MRASYWMGIAAATLAVLLGSCGGGDARMASGGIGGTGISRGPITGFGSVIVNGVHFDTADAAITNDGVAIGEDALHIGMIVTVIGTINADGVTGSADSIMYSGELEGPVTGVSFGDNRFEVMGFTVRVDQDTRAPGDAVFDIRDLQVSDGVEVSGFINAQGEVLATYVERDDDGDDAELKGWVSNIVLGADGVLTFDIGLAADAGPRLAVEVPPSLDISLNDGDFVEVEGSYQAGRILADEVEHEELHDDDYQKVELDGVITSESLNTDGRFVVSGYTVQIVPDTIIEPSGETPKVGDRVELKGSLSNGIVTASKISIKD